MATQHQPTGKEMGLIKVASKHKHNAEHLSECLSKAERTIVKLAKALPDEKDAEDAVWEYAEQIPPWWKGESALVGVLTTIRPYENKKGKVSPAHFTHNGRFLCLVSEENPVPFSYEGYFLITRGSFRFEMNRNAKQIKDFFQPSVENIEPLAVPKRIPHKVARPKVAKPVAEKPKWDDDE